jgi:leader peptidase (prepilin peptidase)/N-methyltransferase
MLGLLIALCAIFGLAIGSFLNVVIYRVPRDESIISPR